MIRFYAIVYATCLCKFYLHASYGLEVIDIEPVTSYMFHTFSLLCSFNSTKAYP
jgi:hypothetical protein